MCYGELSAITLRVLCTVASLGLLMRLSRERTIIKIGVKFYSLID